MSEMAKSDIESFLRIRFAFKPLIVHIMRILL
jgi:hypothetical protein